VIALMAGCSAAFLLLPLLWPAGTVAALCGVTSWLGLDVWRYGRAPDRVAARPLLVFLLVALAATWWSPAPDVSAPRLATLTLGIALAYRIATWPDVRLLARMGALALGSFGLMVSLVGLLLVQFGNEKFPGIAALAEWMRPTWISRVAPFSVNPNGLGVAMVILCPMTLAAMIQRWWPPAGSGARHDVALPWPQLRGMGASVVVTAGAFLTLLALVVSQSRSSWLGVALGLASTAMVRWRLIRWMGVAVVVLAVALLVRQGVPRSVIVADDNSDVATSVGRLELASRLEIWDRALTMVMEAPATGLGLGTFRVLVVTEAPLRWFQGDGDPAHAHNQFLQVAVDTGLPGLAAYLWIVWSALRACATAMRTPGAVSMPATAAWVVLTGALVFGLTDALAPGARVELGWWAVVGLALALQRVAEMGDSAGIED